MGVETADNGANEVFEHIYFNPELLGCTVVLIYLFIARIADFKKLSAQRRAIA